MVRDNPLHDAFVESAVAAGYIHTPDYNGYRQEGFGLTDMTVGKGVAGPVRMPICAQRSNGKCDAAEGCLVEKVLFRVAGRLASYLHNGGKHVADIC